MEEGRTEETHPLRKWEVKKQEAQMSTSIKMTGEELQKLATQSFPVILATVVFVGIVIVDFAFSTTLQAFEKNAKFGISFPGMEQGISFGSFMDESAVEAVLQVQAFNLSTDTCLPRSRQTGGSSLARPWTALRSALRLPPFLPHRRLLQQSARTDLQPLLPLQG